MKAIITAFGMFTKISMPKLEWKESNLKFTLAAFPLIGVLLGLLEYLWTLIADYLNFGTILQAAGLAIIPLVITGGIHLDGFCDTIDALSSYASPERKREILKDPRTGAFAVIWLAVYLIVFFALCSEIPQTADFAVKLGAVFIISRAAASFSLVTFPTANSGGLLDTFKAASSKSTIIFGVLWFIIGGIFAPLSALSAVFCVIYIKFMSQKQFGGMSGDITGFLISICEISGLLGVIICKYI